MNALMRRWHRFFKEEDGLGTLEIILIIAVIVIIAIAFRRWIVHWVQQLLNNSDNKLSDFQNDVNLNIDK